MTITHEQFDSLLTWLGEGDRDVGAQKYETIRAGLVRVFISKEHRIHAFHARLR